MLVILYGNLQQSPYSVSREITSFTLYVWRLWGMLHSLEKVVLETSCLVLCRLSHCFGSRGGAHLESCVQLWSPQHRTDMNLMERCQRRPQKWSEGWNTSAVRKGWESWAVQPAEEKAPGRPYSSLPVPLLPTRRLERDFLQGLAVIGQGAVVLN